MKRLAWVFPGFGVGGAQVRFAALANRFGPAFSHTILSLNGDLACREKLAENVSARFPDPSHRAGKMVAAVAQARRFLRAEKPDLVITSNWGAIEWAIGARLARLPHVHTEDGFGPEERSRQISRRVLIRRLALRGSQVVLPSRTLHRIALEQWRLPERDLHYIPNGIDLARFAAAAPAKLPPGEGPVIGTVAALRPEKNLLRLLRAFAQVRATRPAQLVIVGDGPERAGLEHEAARLGLTEHTLLAGHTQHAENFLAAFEVFALSSDTEQMPLSLLEAMAAGLPAVCTDVGDVRSMLAEENRPYVTALDDKALADGLLRMLTADTRPIGAANRAKAATHFGQEAMFNAYERLLQLERPRGGTSPGPAARRNRA